MSAQSWRSRRTGQSLIEYLAVAIAISAVVIGLSTLLEGRVGTTGQSGSLTKAIQVQFENPVDDADELFNGPLFP